MNQQFSNLKSIDAVNGSVVLRVKATKANPALCDTLLNDREALERINAMITIAALMPKETSKDIMEIVVELIGKTAEAIKQQHEDDDEIPKDAKARLEHLEAVFESATKKADEIKAAKDAK